LKKLPGISLAGIILIVLGVISLIFLLFHFVALDQLEEDFQYKDPYSSILKLAWTTQVVLFSFFLFSFIYFIILARFADKYITTKSVSREQIFVAMNIIGIVCGVVGILLFLLFSQVYNGVQLSIAYKFIPYCFVLLPYLLSLAGCGIRYFRDKRSGWYDEKQNSDINRSGMIALLVSLGVTISLAIFCFHKIPEVFGNIDIAGVVTVLLLPFYCFVVLFVFSVTALYKFKNN
jgi:heme/copper-type cytochrome/quinol oxidase subunit 2